MLFLRTLIFFVAASAFAHGHQVPNMTIEADFRADGSFEMKVNVDPRVFLSTQPESLPPVEAAWFLDQSPEQLKASYQKARAYLEKSLALKFGAEGLPLPEVSWQAMDGATSLAVARETTEVHLLATLKGTVPMGAPNFALGFGPEAKVSLILLLKTPELKEPKVQVIFPGENSRPVVLPVIQRPPVESSRRDLSTGWLIGAGVLIAAAAYGVLRRMKR